MKTKSTGDLMNDLMKANHLNEYIKNNEESLISVNLKDRLSELLKEKNLGKKDAIKASDLNSIYAYQIFSGSRIPSRDKLLQLCFGMKLTVEETQKLLKENGYAPLYAKDKRDSIIIFMLNKGENILVTNAELDEHNLPVLGEK